MDKTARRLWNRRTVERIATAAVALMLLALVATWLTLQHKPAWYRPAQLGTAEIEQAKKESVAMLDWISGQMVAGQPFEITLTQEQINAWLAVLPHAWPGYHEQFPKTVFDPAVELKPGSVHLGFRWKDRGWQAIIGLEWRAGMTEERSAITLGLVHASVGSIQAPRRLLETVLDPVLHAARESGGFAGLQGTEMEDLRSTSQLFDGVAITHRGVWFNGDRPFEITGLTVDNGWVRFSIRPL